MQEEAEEIVIQNHFEELLASDDEQALAAFLNDQNISDAVDLIYNNEEHGIKIMSLLSVHRAVSVFKILELAEQKKVVKNLSSHKAAELLNELPADDRTDFLEELSSSAVRELIKTLNPEERKITLSLLGYPENSVGRLMTPDYVYVYEYNTVAEVLDTIRLKGKNSETIDVIYVINKNGELLDDIRIREFILATPDKKVSELMDSRYIAIEFRR